MRANIKEEATDVACENDDAATPHMEAPKTIPGTAECIDLAVVLC